MNKALFSATWSVAAALLFAGAAAAQKDSIVLTDGTVIDGVSVTGFDLRKVDYKKRGTADSKSTDLVADVRSEKVREYYKRAYAAVGTPDGPGTFLDLAGKSTDAFVKQFGYVEAARLFLRNGQYNDGFQSLEELAAQCPESGFLPLLYTEKLNYYLSFGKDKAGDAGMVANKYSTATQTQGFPPGFAVDAKYFGVMAQAASGGMTGDRLRTQLKSILGEASGFPNIADRCRAQIANSLRVDGKVEEAKKDYEDMLGRDKSSPEVRGAAWLGLGNCQFALGSASDKEPYRAALLSFLRVILETPDADVGTRAEAMYMGSQAAEKWGGDDAGRMARYLKGRLAREFPDSQWNNKR